MTVDPPKLAVLVSGGGRSLENLAETIARGELNARLNLVVSTKAKAFALERAQRLSIPFTVIDEPRELANEEYSAQVFEAVEQAGCDLVVLAGFLRLLLIPDHWRGRVLNIHPSLLPAFGGKGYYGSRVHAAVLERGCWFSGCTVHYVDNEYDQGPILLQRSVRVDPDDSVETLAERVFAEEKLALPEAIRLHVSGESPATRRAREAR